MLNKSLSDSIKDRRSYYDISNGVILSDDRLQEIIEYAVFILLLHLIRSHLEWFC